MSKAFKSDDAESAPIPVPRRTPIPEGVPNYVTPRGLSALRQELRSLEEQRRTYSIAAGDSNAIHLANEVSAKLAELAERIHTAVPIDPSLQPRDVARFGATVTVRSPEGTERVVRIVGVDEANSNSGSIAFVAPLARALLGTRVGDSVIVKAPRGEEELEVLSIRYET